MVFHKSDHFNLYREMLACSHLKTEMSKITRITYKLCFLMEVSKIK